MPLRFSLTELDTLHKAAKILRDSPTDRYTLDDAPILFAAAELLETTTPDLRRALAHFGLVDERSPKTSEPALASAAPVPGPESESEPPVDAACTLTSFPILFPTAAPLSDAALPDAFLSDSIDTSPESVTFSNELPPGLHDVPNGSTPDVTFDLDNFIETNDGNEGLLPDASLDADFFGIVPNQPCDLWAPDLISAMSNDDKHGSSIFIGDLDPLSLDLSGDMNNTWLPSNPEANLLTSRIPLRSTPIVPRLAPSQVANKQKYPTGRGAVHDGRVRREVNDTRQRRACVRCSMQKLKCSPDPRDQRGPCLTCKLTANSIYRMPCLRYKIPDTPLFRYAMYNSSFYLDHPLVGDRYGDFHLKRIWQSSKTRTISALHHGGLRLEIEVREFLPPTNEEATDDRSMNGAVARPMYLIPWAVADPDIETRNLEKIIDPYIQPYVINLLKPSDDLVWPIYQEALRIMSAKDAPPGDNYELIRNTMRLWIGARLADRGWRCFGSDNLGADQLPNQLRPPGWTPLPPYLDYQLVSIVMHRYLAPLRGKVLRNLQKLIKANKASNWYFIFLSCFILLHSCEMTVVIVRKHATKRKSPLRYIIMELVRASNVSAKILLAHFHYSCKGGAPFSKGFDWSSSNNKKMADLNVEQTTFMDRIVQAVHKREDIFNAVRTTDKYEAPYWFISQLFESDWEPRDTHDHSPASDEEYITGKDKIITDKGVIIPLDPFLRPDIEEDTAKRPNSSPKGL